MSFKLDIQDEAIVELQDAYKWYEDQRIGLGDELVGEIELCLSSISEYPERYGYIRQSKVYRRMRVSRFPYMVVYEVIENTVTVVSVFNFKRNKQF
jgi:toxin ParE1/3/4